MNGAPVFQITRVRVRWFMCMVEHECLSHDAIITLNDDGLWIDCFDCDDVAIVTFETTISQRFRDALEDKRREVLEVFTSSPVGVYSKIGGLKSEIIFIELDVLPPKKMVKVLQDIENYVDYHFEWQTLDIDKLLAKVISGVIP